MRIPSIAELAAAIAAIAFAMPAAFAQAPQSIGSSQPPAPAEKPAASLKDTPPGELLPPPPPPPPGKNDMPAPNYDFMRRAIELNLSDDERMKLKRLAFEKPDEFRDELKNSFQALHQKRMDERKKTADLQKAYREAATPEARKKALEDIKVFVQEQFAKKMEMNKKRLEDTDQSLKDAEKRLDEFKRKYEERKAKAAEIVDERVRDIIRDPNLEW